MVISRHVIYIADQSNARQAGDSRASRSQRENNKRGQGKQAGRVSHGVRWERGRKGEGSARSGGEVGVEGCFNRESQEGGSVPHPSLDAASSGIDSSPGPGSPSPAQPQIDSAQRPDWPEPGSDAVGRAKLKV